jgi:hypothetical protein
MFDSPQRMLEKIVRAGAALLLASAGLATLPSCTVANGIAADPSVAPAEAATQLCANGTWIPQTDICPSPPPASDPPAFATKMCLDGTVVTATEICSSQVCPDGSRIPSSQICPQPQAAILAPVPRHRQA